MAFALAVPFDWNIIYPDFHGAVLPQIFLPQGGLFCLHCQKATLHALLPSIFIALFHFIILTVHITIRNYLMSVCVVLHAWGEHGSFMFVLH